MMVMTGGSNGETEARKTSYIHKMNRNILSVASENMDTLDIAF